jgi:uncharacterized repeat protein (TIGR03803 family)
MALQTKMICVLAMMIGITANGIAQAPAVTFTDLHDVNTSVGDLHNFNSGKLAQARDGNFYIEVQSGGVSALGGISSFSPLGVMNTVFSFNGTDGAVPTGGLTLGVDAQLYGDAQSGVTNNDGATFKITTTGIYTSLHNFTNTGDGYGPVNALVLATDGNFYGLTNSNPETFYRVTPAGVLTTLHTFTNAEGFQGGQLIQGSDGNLYGGLNLGGNGWGTLFKATTSGTVTVLHTFAIGGSDGASAAGGMAQASNGTLLGTTYAGGTNGIGVLYKITSTGTYTALRNFTSSSDGANPLELIPASDNNLYGVTVNGGANNCGTLFRVTAAGAFSVVYNFTSATGCNPASMLTQGTDGKLYGVTNTGGAHSSGTFYSVDLGLPTFVTLLPAAGKVGSKIGILGQGFTSSSVVKFNGTAGTTVSRTGSTFLLATVPSGASDGFVTVTTGSTTLTSLQKFTVHDSWGAGAVMPVNALASCAAVLNSQIYVVGGYNTSPLTNVQVYNPATNNWSTGTALASGVSNQACAAVNGAIYEFGGTTNNGVTQTNAVSAYNPTTKTWSSKAVMPTARQDVLAVVANNLVYVIDGYNGNRLATVDIYNPASDSWTVGTSLLTPQSGDVGGLISGSIVISGGAGESVDSGDTESFSLSANKWTALKPDTNVRNNPCGGAIGAALYVAGGANRAGNAFNINESFTPSKNSWITLAPLPQATVDPASAVSGGELFCFGGWATFQGTVLNNTQIYQP